LLLQALIFSLIFGINIDTSICLFLLLVVWK